MRLASIAALAALALCLPGPAVAEAPHPAAAAATPDLSATVPPHPLPAPVTTEHMIQAGGRTLHFKATAGAIRLSDAASGEPIADIGVTVFRLEGEAPATRPVTFAINGGPGASSAWLDLCAIGPWRLPVPQGSISPSMPTHVVDNADTWLDITDLVFIDPVGTGYSRMLAKGDEAEKSFTSVDGDVGALATVIRKWLVANDRLASPKYIVGESYGGFRAPKIARKLRDRDNIAVSGIVMISPVLDFAWFTDDSNPAVTAARLPSLVAAARGLRGDDPRARLADVEAYAGGPYLVDLFKGVRDAEAVKRMSDKVAALTGLDEPFVARLAGRVDAALMTREKNRAAQRIASRYDANVTGYDASPFDATSHGEDPVLDALRAPVATAMAQVTAERLKWPVNATYEILNMKVNSHWQWGSSLHAPEAMGDLSSLLSLDPNFRAVVMHGVTDEVTPYFTSKMLIDQLPPYGDADRLRLDVYGGGHMPYLLDDARASMHTDAVKLIAPPGTAGRL